MSNRKRIISLAIISIFGLAGLALAFPGSVSKAIALAQARRPVRKKPPSDREALAKKPAPTGTLKDRMAEDDGYGLVIFYSSTVHGNLEVCGCPIRPLGGVARRMGYINAFAKRSPDAAILQVDAGRIFSDDKNEAGDDLRADARLMNDWIVRANEVMNLDVVNLSSFDLPYVSSLLKPDANLKPQKTSLISANIKNADGSGVSPAPYVIKVVTGKRLRKPLRIAFIGVSDAGPDEMKAVVAKSGMKIEDPFAAAKAALTEVHDKADLTVIVGFLTLPMVNRLARQNDDLDLIINADERGLVPDPKQVNNALIVYAAKETKHLGELRVYNDAEGIVDRFTARYVELDEIIPDDPKLGAITKQARRELDALQARLAEEEAKEYLARNPAGVQSSPYVLSETCAKCHQTEYAVWRKSRHSHAFAALETKKRTFDSACIGCHSLGYQQSGFVNIKATPQLANVQCESCHGPGATHVAAPAVGNYKTPPNNTSCLSCHDRDNSPDFDFKKYWPVIAHKNSIKKK